LVDVPEVLTVSIIRAIRGFVDLEGFEHAKVAYSSLAVEVL
jgi:hypothetical protein